MQPKIPLVGLALGKEKLRKAQGGYSLQLLVTSPKVWPFLPSFPLLKECPGLGQLWPHTPVVREWLLLGLMGSCLPGIQFRAPPLLAHASLRRTLLLFSAQPFHKNLPGAHQR